MENYPKDIMKFEEEFSTEDKCRDYIIRLREELGINKCSECGCEKTWLVKKNTYECSNCHHQESILSGTIFQDTHKPLTLWFRAMWYITSLKTGTSALGLQRVLGLGSYKTAWTWLHKLRRSMVRPGRDRLKGRIEVDESYFGAPESGGKRGRGTENKVLVIIAVEINDDKVGRIRIADIPDATQESIHSFIEETIEHGSTIISDGWPSYGGLELKGYIHEIDTHNSDIILPHVHTVISLVKRWMMGTLQGSYSREQISYYFDEFTFRFNRRTSKSRGMLFYRLLQNAIQIAPVPYKDIIAKKDATCLK
jgi:transposase-like protein